jgi:cyclophilin family peptidyl-prolyl cis-trans isomerase
MTGKQAVIETTAGRIVIDLLPAQAPNHVGYFIKLAQEGAYNGTTFHRLIKHGIIQGGDPLSKDPAKAGRYGTGGLKMLAFEPGAGSHVRGAVSSVLVPGNRDSAGSQFFICVTPQAALDGQYTVFGGVVEGIGIVTKISEAPADPAGRATDRIEIASVTIRDAPPSGVEPFSTESVADLARYRAVLETSLGNITIEFLPGKAPNHVRNFLRLADAGVYDQTPPRARGQAGPINRPWRRTSGWRRASAFTRSFGGLAVALSASARSATARPRRSSKSEVGAEAVSPAVPHSSSALRLISQSLWASRRSRAARRFWLIISMGAV